MNYFETPHVTYKILIVDDLVSNVLLLENFLLTASENYQVLKAFDGKSACSIAEENTPDLIIMDWEMPEMTGIEAIKYLSQHEKTFEIPIIMLTSLSSSKKLEEALHAGAMDYIKKPFDKVELLARVSSTLRLSQYYHQIKLQKQIIEEKNKQITESIKSASYIQETMRISPAKFKNEFADAFVLFLPRDIISGDFYWLAKFSEDNILYLAAADCTGHGVPGAILAMMGNILLNDIVNQNHTLKPNAVLNELNHKVKKALRQDESENDDGMEIALCMIDYNSCNLYYSGAIRPLVYIQNEQLNVINGNFIEIGGISSKKESVFTCHTLSFVESDIFFYLYSDGFTDQMGYGNKKFGTENLNKFINRIHLRSFDEQKIFLTEALHKWMDSQKQTDDIMMLGVKIESKN